VEFRLLMYRFFWFTWVDNSVKAKTKTLKTKAVLRLLSAIAIAMLLFSCATESVPLGGPEDKTPPELKAANPPNKSIRFTANRIELTFNEFIQSSSSFNQTIISPSLKEKPDIIAKGKTVIVKLKSELQPNTTYTLNFGDDIKDINQSNTLSNFTYVFSTGSFIDSQKISGKVINAEDGTPADGHIVSLYAADSVNGILSSKPLYFSKTNSSGLYTIQNVRAGFYSVFVLKDQNFNYIYDQPNEQIGFSNQLLDLTDSISQQLDLISFAEKKKKLSLLSVKSLEPGKALIAYSGEVKSLKLQGELVDNGFKIYSYPAKDSLIIWFSNYYIQKGELLLVANDTLLDTVRIELKITSKDSAAVGKPSPLSIVNQLIKGVSKADNKEIYSLQSLYGSLKTNLTRPITEINENKRLQILDSATNEIVFPEFKLDEKTSQELSFSFPRKEMRAYTLIIPDSTFKDIFGFWNKELRWNFRTNTKEDFGNIHVKVSVLDASKKYVVKLLNSANETVESVALYSTTSASKDFTNLPAGNYSITILEDTNVNGEWDTGNFLERKQPEKLTHLKDIYTLKGGWDLDIEVKF
jgi:uncharacterized protein (DUF2141 family)